MNQASRLHTGTHSSIPLRSPDEVTTLACMGSAHQHRLSFMRILLRRIKREGWTFSRPVWDLDAEGYGTAVYTAKGPERSYSLVCFSHHLDPAHRSDRVIATAWDATFTLFDGVPAPADLDRLRANVPLQEAGRVSRTELSVSRTNRSVRVFDHVVERLSTGLQPDEGLINDVGYLMRTTAVYGSGKLGAADYEDIAERPEFHAPFQAEMLSVYLTRQFTLDLVEHIAHARAPEKAVRLLPRIRRQLGVGNSTGLGLAPYLVNHPALLNAWMVVRETALARVRNVQHASDVDHAAFLRLVGRAQLGTASWRTDDVLQQRRVATLSEDLNRLDRHLRQGGFAPDFPWNALYRWASDALSLEARELVVSLLIEGHPALVDELEALYRVREMAHFHIDGSRRISDVVALLDRHFAWSLKFDFSDPAQNARFWYTSEEKLEPRLGDRWNELGSELELPLAIARNTQDLRTALLRYSAHDTLAAFLMAHPEHRHTIRRLMIAETAPYSEIRDNIVDAGMRPVDILRLKLSFFGATRFDPRSDRWVRITMYQHAPCMDELHAVDVDDWFLPSLPD